VTSEFAQNKWVNCVEEEMATRAGVLYTISEAHVDPIENLEKGSKTSLQDLRRA
jgi:hypothetical protein